MNETIKDNHSPIANNSKPLGYQVACGTFDVSPLSQHALVISQGWPSWTFALEGLGFESVSTIASFESLSSREEFKATSMGTTLIKKERVSEWAVENNQQGVVFVQGDAKFLDLAYQKLKGFQDLICILGCSDIDFSTSDSWREQHSLAGGVTDGNWSFYSPNIDLPKLPSFGIQRSLRHVLRTTEGECSDYKLNKSATQTLSSESRVQWKDKYPKVLTPSVFKKMKCITRLLTEEELMDVYDIELNTQQELLKYWRSKKVVSTRAYSQQIPVKVLREVANRVAKVLTKLVIKNKSVELESTSSRDNPNESITCNDHTISDKDLEEEKPKLDNADPTKIKRDRAACDDDAEAVAEDWDIWTVENFEQASTIKPIICTGRYVDKMHQPFFLSLRNLMLRRYRRNVLKSLLKYLKSEYYPGKTFVDNWSPLTQHGGTVPITLPKWIQHRKPKLIKSRKKRKDAELWKDLAVGRDAVGRAANSTWWNWDAGSTLFFWRWPRWSKKGVRDGIELFIDWSNMPNYWKRQQWPDEEHSINKLRSKLSNVRMKKYVQPGFVKSLTSYFAVPKAETDVRIVYDGTACGLNDGLWAPNFMLPTVDSVLRNASSSTWFGDIDLGEMFLNYPLDERIRPYAGVDLTYVDNDVNDKKAKRIIERWSRCLMGFKPSPYVTTQTFAWSEEIILGDHLDESNPFYWDEVKLNFPGLSNYQPSMPWVYKWNNKQQEMASFFGTYIDDIRAGGATELACRKALHKIASLVNYLGQQDAPRKRGQPTQTPRAWAGAKCISRENDGLYVLSMETKWKKAKKIISDFYKQVVIDDNPMLDFKKLESDVGFLCHVSRTYPIIFPYLKGFYNTLNNWRWDRNVDGWKLSKTSWMELISGDIAFDTQADEVKTLDERKRNFKKRFSSEAPATLKSVPRLANDLRALKELFSPDCPTLRLVRGAIIKYVLLSFGDASGGGFGSSWEIDDKIEFRFGTWDESMSYESSNLRELTNLVDTLEEMDSKHNLTGTEVFLFTDNSTSEAAFYNGSSKSEKLFDLVLRTKKLEMHRQTKFHIIHVSGERMKVQGSDGLSRGNLNVGVMAGKRMLDFVPIHMTALERSCHLKPWIETFIDTNAEWLTPSDWFSRGHDIDDGKFEINSDGLSLPCIKSGTFVWAPAPCAAEVAVEELRKARHKRQQSQHLFIVPRLMQPMWRKHLYKAADIVLTLKPGHPAWPTNMYEPLTIAFIFPFIRCKPWQLRGSPQLMALGRQLSGVWNDDKGREGPLLRELWSYQKRLENMPSKLASKMLQSEQPIGDTDRQTRKRRRCEVEEKEGGIEICKRKKW